MVSSSRRGRVVSLSTVHHGHDNRVFNKEAKALVAAGYDYHLVISADRDGVDQGVPVVALHREESRIRRLVVSQREAWHQLRVLEPDVLHIHDPELIPLALAWRQRHRCKVIYDAHEDLIGQVDTKPYLGAVTRPLARMAARGLVGLAGRSADAVVAATPTVGERFHHAPVTVVRNYPWLSNYTTTPNPVPGRLAYVGDLSEERKLSFMIEVTRKVRQRVSGTHLVLAGRVLPRCQETVEQAVAEGFVEHLGLVAPTEVPQVLASAQVGLVFLKPLPNYVASLPTKLFEYMASQVPFAASDFQAWREMFDGFGAGVFVDTEDVTATANALSELLADPQRCRKMGYAGRRAVELGLNFESQAEALTDLVAGLLEG
ncbi:glycosyltransferase family 4 protein [Cutibacterium sp. WCA-380-WT-3A]|uniref:Glycosyltransferase family 4 protein n=1 Tax=Cutibacterium porci TaxID=2605781 RepID=A0A7K0J4D9_9ACTN|nr:glycosyltransferase family 4 protein [Cutibacterium porci]MSS44799.1 glycosyltransferase family 4 protein [Cutibacterium porci]